MAANKTPEGRNLNNRMQARFIGRGLRRKNKCLSAWKAELVQGVAFQANLWFVVITVSRSRKAGLAYGYCDWTFQVLGKILITH